MTNYFFVRFAKPSMEFQNFNNRSKTMEAWELCLAIQKEEENP